MELKDLLSMTPEEIQLELEALGEPKFRALQIFQWMHKGVKSFDGMTNLSYDLKQKLRQHYYINSFDIEDKLVSKLDGTAKYLLKLRDGNMIETVLMEYKHGMTLCISSQVGCKMGCKFCASTGAGFKRNLSPGEILDQVLTVQTDSGKRIGNIVIMGIGEPLDNYDNILKFLSLVNHPKGLNIGMRHISVSTCGLVPEMLRLAKENLGVTLSISLHAPNDDIRREIMPIAQKYSIDKIIGACKIYTEETGRRITFEYALIEGVNDSKSDAQELAKRIRGILCHVNLIPVNSVPGASYRQSRKESIRSFQEVLEKSGIECTVRRELGSDISAACGQLRRNRIEE